MQPKHIMLLTVFAAVYIESSAAAFQGMHRAPFLSGHRHNRQNMGGWTSPVLASPRSPRLRTMGKFTLGGLRTVATASTAAPAMPLEKFRKDYKAPDYSIRTVDLTFKIFKGYTQASSIHNCDYIVISE